MRKIAAALAALGLFFGLAVTGAGPAHAEEPDPGSLFTVVPWLGHTTLDFYNVSPKKVPFDSLNPQPVTVDVFPSELAPAAGSGAEVSFVKALVYDASECSIPEWNSEDPRVTSQTLYDYQQCGVLAEGSDLQELPSPWRVGPEGPIPAVSLDVAVPYAVASGDRPTDLYSGGLRVVAIHKVTLDGVVTYVYKTMRTFIGEKFVAGTRISSFEHPTFVLNGRPVTFSGYVEAFNREWEAIPGAELVLDLYLDLGSNEIHSGTYEATAGPDGRFEFVIPGVPKAMENSSGIFRMRVLNFGDCSQTAYAPRCPDAGMLWEQGPLVSFYKVPDFDVTPTPTISGKVRVGSKITANPKDWGPTPDKFSYQWKRNGVNIGNATGSTYTPTISDLGQNLTVSVTGSLTIDALSNMHMRATKTSAKHKVAVGVITPKRPTISGTVKKGKTLTVKPGAWSPSGVAFKYQWYRGSSKISGAKKSTYKLVSADKGKRVKVVVTGSKSGYTTASSTSAQTAKVK